MQDARDQEIASLKDELSTLRAKLDLGRLLYEDATAEIARLKEAIVSVSRFVEKTIIDNIR